MNKEIFEIGPLRVIWLAIMSTLTIYLYNTVGVEVAFVIAFFTSMPVIIYNWGAAIYCKTEKEVNGDSLK